ncbi:MAG TPA: tetratricopeptide repeat protein [Candidatus Cloacimonadota bacterium]|nr:tetratricopeptide repeat protein [Candidatus Cloacimonadota bacterium]HPT71261.1 tetratricopeptide repeat protein [Candidatus Cloacimonadota bacterium]
MNIRNLLIQAEHLMKGNWISAVNLLENALKDHPSEKDIYEMLGDIYIQERLFQKAIDNYQKALTFDKKNAQYLFKIGNAYLSLDEPRLSLYYFDQIHDFIPEALYNKAIAYTQMGRLEESIDALSSMLKHTNPFSELPYTFLAEQLIQLRQYAKALKVLNEAEKRYGQSPSIKMMKAFCFYYQKNWLKAYVLFRESEKSNWHSAAFYHAKAVCSEEIGRYEEAETAFNRCIEMEPHIPKYYEDLARLLDRMGKSGAILPLLKRARKSLGGLTPELENYYKDLK